MMNHVANRPVRIASVEVLSGFSVRLSLTDGTSKVVDLERFLHGPVFESIRTDRRVFESVRVDARAGTIIWPNGADIDPDVLCQDLTPAPAGPMLSSV